MPRMTRGAHQARGIRFDMEHPLIGQSTHSRRSGSLGAALAYGLMIVTTVGGFFLTRHFGEGLTAPALEISQQTGESAPGGKGSGDALFHVLVAMAAVIIVGRSLGAVFKYFGQPPVIGEVLAGICLGPSLLGQVAPSVSEFILPASVAPSLGVISQLGVVLYMFTVGLELDPRTLRQHGHTTVAISHASIVVPFLLGSGLALVLYPILSHNGVPFTVFALFLGVSMSVTAFPVLARILTDRRMSKSPMGVLALACAAIDDVTAWCLLAFVVGVAQAKVGGAFAVVAMTFAYIVFMFLIVRPLITRIGSRFQNQELTQGGMACLLVLMLCSALTTELIGVHAIFGAFLLGAVISHESRAAQQLCARLEDLVGVLLLPSFFAFTGMRTRIGLVSGMENWMLCGLIILIATAGKFGGTLAAARLTGLGWRDSSSLGILMNTRGLMELIVLNIGLDLQVISPTLFAMLVLMAVVTTVATTPILRAIAGHRYAVVGGGNSAQGIAASVSHEAAVHEQDVARHH